MIPTFFILSILLIVWIYYQTNRTNRARKASEDSFWEKERLANTTRKKDISVLDYITVPVANLPFPECSDEEISEIQRHLKNLSTSKIVNFTGLTNTELKLRYGAPNIDLLMEYDRNYLELVRSLYRYGKLLYDHNYKDEAAAILEYGLTIGTDVSANYTLLATIYKEKNEGNRIDFIISKAEALQSMTKRALLSNLMAIRDSSVSQQ